MKTFILTAACAAILTSPAAAHDDRYKVECEKTKQKISNIESRMRQGYTRAQGEKWSAKLRELRADRSKQCR